MQAGEGGGQEIDCLKTRGVPHSLFSMPMRRVLQESAKVGIDVNLQSGSPKAFRAVLRDRQAGERHRALFVCPIEGACQQE